MKRIFKYELEVAEHQVLKLPKGSHFLSVESQKDNIVLYAVVDDSQPNTVDLSIKVVGTGQDVSNMEDFGFLGTVKLWNDSLMFHIFYNSREV